MTVEPNVLVIQAGQLERRYWRDLWHYRELLIFLAWRDILVRYKQTLLGVAWVLVRPLLTMLVFTIVFGKLAGLPAAGAPYPVMVLAAMLPWQLFAGILTDTGNSIVNNGNLISKVYFPRLLVPLSTVLAGLIDFAVSAAMMSVLMLAYGVVPDMRLLALPGLLLLTLAFSLGIGLWLSALNVKYRDFRFIAAFAIQFGLYISPVGFSSTIIPEQWRLLYSLNPMVGIIDGFRWALLPGHTPFYWPALLLSVAFAAVTLFSAIAYFRKVEKTFADSI